MGGALVRVFPTGDVMANAVRAHSTAALSWGRQEDANSGVAVVLTSTNITPNYSGDVVGVFIGGTVRTFHTGIFSPNSCAVRLYVGTTQVAEHRVDGTATQLVAYSAAVVSNTSTNVYADYYHSQSSGGVYHTGLSMAAISVTT